MFILVSEYKGKILQSWSTSLRTLVYLAGLPPIFHLFYDADYSCKAKGSFFLNYFGKVNKNAASKLVFAWVLLKKNNPSKAPKMFPLKIHLLKLTDIFLYQKKGFKICLLNFHFNKLKRFRAEARGVDMNPHKVKKVTFNVAYSLKLHGCAQFILTLCFHDSKCCFPEKEI